jgi:hypothetical protein
MILLALGSNRGNREEFLSQARTVLMAYDIHILAQSSIHETPALMPEGAPADWDMPFLNQVIAVDSHLSPLRSQAAYGARGVRFANIHSAVRGYGGAVQVWSWATSCCDEYTSRAQV